MDITRFHAAFFEESRENLDAMEAGLLAMESGSADGETINVVFRAAHSIKGGAATFGFTSISELTHQLETLLDEARSGRRFLAVVYQEMPVLDPPAVSMQDFTLRSANIWATSPKGFDDGVVLFVFVRERKLRLEVGRALATVLTGEVAQRIVDEKITPDLKRGDTAGGLEAGIDAVIAVLDSQPKPAPSAPAPSPTPSG